MHMDLCEAGMIAINGAHYFIAFTDDYTRRVTVYYLKGKDEAATKCQEYLTYIERQINCQPKALRADNGREFLNKNLKDWCQTKGIEIQTSAPYSPHQNRVAERMNRTLIELARAMLLARSLPHFLWTEATTHAAYLRNRSHTQALTAASTPEERWTGKRPDIAHLKEFGAPVWILREGLNIPKLDPKSEKHIFVGFQDGPKAIKYYNSHTRQIKITRNYHFTDTAPDTLTPEPNVEFEGEGQGSAAETGLA